MIFGGFMTKTYPTQIYPIKVRGMWTSAVRTREYWNVPSTGRFISHDADVEDVMFRIICENPKCINSGSILYFEQSMNKHDFKCDACGEKMKVIDFNENPDV